MEITTVQPVTTTVTEDMKGGVYLVVSACSTAAGAEILLSVFVSLHKNAYHAYEFTA